ncbi:CoA transferase [Amycolatopsis jiangsuensis]|uniref:Crotonobetainyl-CoA:carnitine CoA-transferase CaiB-like acyl-CoA transferase n=1 Tax=Amycolatopsis jiangsuensis TaxID=1181879 RepID=A0A840J165_9PSEU|nr:CoA transferase [Amycolatopsis jiangsuensis]MBB4688736.1 crotonobetainyl-CoA:carnitine CoA-transferase CaiB-like acyl-CoA transferase [Amycolatopsis jiangsuensis]
MKSASPSAFEELMTVRDAPRPDAGEVTITGSDPLFASPLRIGSTLADALAARAVAANDLWELRTGRRQQISVDVRAAAATALGGEDMTLVRGPDGAYHPVPLSPDVEHMVSLTQPWETADGRFFLPHFNLPHLERRVLDVLRCSPTPESVRAAVRKWKADDLEDAIAAADACGGVVRSPAEWLAHPHGAHLATRPVVEITKIGDSEPESLSGGARATQPLSGVRVLDLTRILAGPTAALSLAEHGADVLMVTAPQLPQVPPFVRDTSHGKRSTYLDYTRADEAAKLRELAAGADVFVEGYRPGRMSAHGFGPEDLAQLRPGVVYVTVNCFGSGGPFATRAGWDQVAQAVTGCCEIQGTAGRPQLTPVYLCDFLTGFLGGYGAMLALARRAREGGSYHVQVSLCQSAMLVQRQGLLDDFSGAPGRLRPDEFERYAVVDDSSGYGDLKSLGPVIRMSETPPRWSRTIPELGSSRPEWT